MDSNKILDSVFKELNIHDTKIIELLKASCFIVKKKKSEVLFEQGSKGSIIYYLLDGKIKLYRLDEKGNECVINFIQKNEFFAEILLVQDTYPVSAQALETSIMVAIDKNKLLPLLKSSFEFSLNIITMLVKRINYLVDTIERLSTQDAKEKFLNYIAFLSKTKKSNTVTIDIPKQELALLLGMAKETLSRVEKQLSSDGIIEVNNRQIKILKQILP